MIFCHEETIYLSHHQRNCSHARWKKKMLCQLSDVLAAINTSLCLVTNWSYIHVIFFRIGEAQEEIGLWWRSIHINEDGWRRGIKADDVASAAILQIVAAAAALHWEPSTYTLLDAVMPSHQHCWHLAPCLLLPFLGSFLPHSLAKGADVCSADVEMVFL